jgi:hypothetical protein
MKINNKKLFLKYAIPCAETLVKRGQINQERLNELIEKIVKNKKIFDEDVDMFKVAKAHSTILAKELGKDEIDEEVIEKYFLEKHDEVVDERFEQMNDFDPDKCRIKNGKVLSIGNGEALVETTKNKSSYRIDFVPDIKRGDFVIVHRDFIVRKISK